MERGEVEVKIELGDGFEDEFLTEATCSSPDFLQDLDGGVVKDEGDDEEDGDCDFIIHPQRARSGLR